MQNKPDVSCVSQEVYINLGNQSWVPSHVDIESNETPNKFAKIGASEF